MDAEKAKRVNPHPNRTNIHKLKLTHTVLQGWRQGDIQGWRQTSLHHIKTTIQNILQKPLQIQGWIQQQVQPQRHQKTNNAANSQTRARVFITKYVYNSDPQGEGTCHTISNIFSNKAPCFTYGRKMRLNIFEEEIKIDITAQTTLPGNTLVITDEETGEAMEYQHKKTFQQRNLRMIENIICKWDW